ncbi:probable disease resistance protein At4g27220 [Camellia sinensis]|uniref:probable disease resistance protein At4g27220 n=1 Tax=Camellia sinensis TaxID=4442 RepID=UPI001035BF0F|nr:probable disease resistance protein At4g27220 [Camellia sinensis]
MCSPQTILDKIVDKIVAKVIQSVVSHIRFVTCYKGNLEKLDAEKKNLEGQWLKVNEDVDKYKTLGEDIEANVSNWLTEADKMIKEVEEFEKHKTDKESMQCFKFSCPDYISRYKLSKQAERKIGDIKNLTQEGKFDKVSHRKPPPQKLLFPSSAHFVSLDYMSFDSRESVFKRIMDALKDSKVYKIGVHGLGGVGKTKMVEEVGKQVKKDGLFDEVVMAVVSQDANVRKIQLQLVGGLNPKPDVVTITDEHERAKELWLRLDNGKKNLIILDDIWHELSLDTIGIPITGRNKVVITSRNQDVWKNMEMDTEIQIKVLSEPEAWALFKNKVGDSVDSDQELHDIAKEVCKECQGLPVAILVVGGALKGKQKCVWKNALEKLKKSMLQKIEGISPMLYDSLKLSYVYLSEDAKSCFLLCCMFPEDAEIPIEELVRHCMARRLLAQKPDTLEEARDTVCTVVNTLKTCSLLLDGTDENVVKMHDVIRDVAVSIADDEKAILVKHGVHEWPEKGTYESYLAISLRSKTVHEVPNKLGCSQLHTLLLECIDPLVTIPDMFFDGMEKLTVLELNGVRMLQLPPSLANLVNLRMLCLHKCQLGDITILKDLKNNLEVLSLRGSDIKALPSEIGQLTQLRLLDLRDCYKLSKIPKGVISNLSRLEELYILNSFVGLEDATVNKELDKLGKLTPLTTLHIHIPNAMLLPKEICFKNLIRFIISTGERSGNLEYQSSTRIFKLVGVPLRDEFNVLLERAEVLHLEKVEGLQKVYHRLYPSGSFNKLTVLTIKYCKLKYLFSPSCARGLLQIQRLVIKDCEVMEGIVGNEGEENEEAVTSEAINFSQLKYMELRSLPSLVSFYPKMEKTTTAKENSSTQAHSLFNEKVTFPALEELSIHGLPKLTEIKEVLENGEKEEKAENNTSTISFPHLTRMNFDNLESLKSFCTSRSETQSFFTSQVTFPALVELYIAELPKLAEIWDRKLLPLEFFKELRDVTIWSCEKLVNVGSSNMHRQLPKLKELYVRDCQELKVVVLENGKKEEKAENNTSTISFPHLTRMNFNNLESLKSFCTSRSKTQSLFTSQVMFPALVDLFISGLPKLTEIWDRKLLPLEFFKELRDVTILFCEKLVNVGPSNMHRQLPKLKGLHVWGCQELKVVVLENGEKDEKAENNTSTISFPHLTRMNLNNLESLESFCTSRSETQSLFTSQVTFPALQELFISELPKLTEIWDRKLLPLEFFKELRDVTIWGCEKLVNVGSSNMHRQLPKLKGLYVRDCQELKVVVLENGEKEEKAENNTSTISFPHLTRMNFNNLETLKSFCTSRSETQSLFTSQVTFPALQELFI